MDVVYFSSKSENTKRFVQKLQVYATRIPIEDDPHAPIQVTRPYILICPTYSGGDKTRAGKVITTGAVPAQVIHFLNDVHNRSLCRGVIATGNTNFGDSYAIAGPILSHKLGVPLLYQFELSGTAKDVSCVQKLIESELSLGK